MHERYSHPALVFLASYTFLYKKPMPYILASLAIFLNMEDVMRYFELSNYHTMIFSSYFVDNIAIIRRFI